MIKEILGFNNNNKTRTYTLEDINGINVPTTKARKIISIAIIDDHEPDYLNILSSNGFIVEYFPDINSIDEIARFQIVVCDINGVGNKLMRNTEVGGIHIIEQIQKFYPLTYIIAMSSRINSLINSDLIVEGRIYKEDDDSDCKRLLEQLDKGVSILSSSYEQWVRIRNNLINVNKLGIEVVSRLEHQYIHSLVASNPKILLESEDVKSNANIKELFTNITHSAVWDGLKTVVSTTLGAN